MTEKTEINDRVVRLIGIPFFGILIPNASGLVINGLLGPWQLWVSYAWFIFGAGAIWQGNRYLLFKNIHRGDWLTSPLKRLQYVLGINAVYTLSIATLQLWMWSLVFPPMGVEWTKVAITVAIIFVCVIFITSAYELIYQVKMREHQRLKAEQLESAKILAELEALKSHIDPHFMFNSLNLVSYLIDNHPQRAKLFVENLSDVYRYILQSKSKDLVLLADEMDFTRKYIHLLELRFENALVIGLELNDKNSFQFLIPPVSVMMAVENAVKHNEASGKNKLHIQILQQQNSLLISNNLAEKKNIRYSSKTGLANLSERFKRIMGHDIEISRENNNFRLKLPLLPLAAQ